MRILAIASAGGHWVQLLRTMPAFKDHHTTYVSTNPELAKVVEGHQFICIKNASRWNKFRLLGLIARMFQIVNSLKPDVIISTGAAPGLIGIIVGKLLMKKTIWIDSLANVESVSLSGRIATRFADRVYTQWPHLKNEKIMFKGSVIK